MQTIGLSPLSIIILLVVILVLWVIVLVGSLTRPQRYGRFSTGISSLALFAVLFSAANLGIELLSSLLSLLQGNLHIQLTDILVSALILSLGVPLLYVTRRFDLDKIPDASITQQFDVAANDAFTVGITLQVVILTLFTSNVLIAEDAITLLILIVIAQLFTYVLSFFWHARSQRNQSFISSQPTRDEYEE